MDWKKKHKRINLIGLLFVITMSLFTPVFSFSQANEKPATWSNEQWEDAKKGLNYDEKEKKKEKKKSEDKKESLEDDTSSWNIADKLQDIFNSTLGKIISIIIIVGLLLFTIIKLLVVPRNDSGKKITPVSIPESFEDIEDNLPESDLERFLRLALDSKDYRQAVRILFLSTIQKLNDTGLIEWKKDKTNRDYLIEMRKHNQYNGFKDLTLAYEIVWYGDTEISSEVYEKLNPVFINYNNNLNGDGKKQ